MTTYTPDELAKLTRYGQVTGNGVVYHEELAGPGGMGFRLLREPHHTDADMAAARKWLYERRDVVGPIKEWHPE